MVNPTLQFPTNGIPDIQKFSTTVSTNISNANCCTMSIRIRTRHTHNKEKTPSISPPKRADKN